MQSQSARALLGALTKRALGAPFSLLPEGALKFRLRAAIVSAHKTIAPEFLVRSGETAVLVGFHRIDSVMLWSHLVGPDGRIILIEAVPEYINNIRANLEHHLNWPLLNIVYVAKGVDSRSGRARIQIGSIADYNKLAEKTIEDGLTEGDYIRELEIETTTVDDILEDLKLDRVDHVHITISGLEVEALKGMSRTLARPGLRVHVRSLHARSGQLLYPKVIEILRASGMKTVVGPTNGKFKGRDVYGARIPARISH